MRPEIRLDLASNQAWFDPISSLVWFNIKFDFLFYHALFFGCRLPGFEKKRES
jgi:hypothetical protein